MANDLLNALRRKVVQYETAGMTEQADRARARLAVEEKAVKKADKAEEKAAEAEASDPVNTEKAAPAKKEKT